MRSNGRCEWNCSIVAYLGDEDISPCAGKHALYNYGLRKIQSFFEINSSAKPRLLSEVVKTELLIKLCIKILIIAVSKENITRYVIDSK